MRRRELIKLLGGAALAVPFPARGEQARKVRRIGVLETTSQELNAANIAAFRQGMRQQGLEEGRDFVLDYRFSGGQAERFPQLAAELVRQKVDLILTRGTPAVLAAKKATTTIPIVMAAIGEALEAVASLANPGANVTGLSAFVTELEAKRLELLSEVIPGLSRIGHLINLSNPIAESWRAEIVRVAPKLKIEPQLLDVRRVEDFGAAFEAASREHAGALMVVVDGLMQTNRHLIAELAAKHRLPTIYPSKEFVDAGGLLAYGVSYPDLYRRAATYVDKILKGAAPTDLPIEQPVRFELIVNLKTAKVLGITVPSTVLARADEVIE
jgi:putative ABC transport system substrate-binding protein